MSQHAIEVVRVNEIKGHPNADRLELIDVFGWTVCVGARSFATGDLAIYIPPDYVVETTRPEFAFLKREGRDVERIAVKRLRGVLSQGLLIPVPASMSDAIVGDNMIDQLGIVRYEAPLPTVAAEGIVGAPSGLYAPKFDVESFQRYASAFTEGEDVRISEKLHGACARYVWQDGQMHVGSRTNWWRDEPSNQWWRALRQCPQIETLCQACPGTILFGKVFGQVQTLKYGAGKEQIFFAAFAALHCHNWLDYADLKALCDEHNVPMAPHVYSGPL